MTKNQKLTTVQIMATKKLQLIWNAKRKELGLTQEKVAMLCQWNTQSAFSAYLLGRVPLNTEAVLRLSKILEVHPTEIMPELSRLLPSSDLEITIQQEKVPHKEKNMEDLDFNNIRKELASELMIAYEKIASQHTEKNKRSTELVLANAELAFQSIEKEKRADELVIANEELAFQSIEKEKRSEELVIANEELAFQKTEKKKRSVELVIANKELTFQNSEKEKRADELAIANQELAFQNSEKQKRADELVIANKELAFQNSEKQKRADELAIANEELTFQSSEKEKRADELAIANKELAFQNCEKQKRADELAIANEELTFQNSQKEKRAAELVLANKELVFQNSEKEKRAAELSVANRELAFQNLQKEKRAAELIVANKELAFQNSEKEKRADELSVANRELAFQNNEKRKQAEELIILNDKLLAQSLEKENSASAFIIANEELIFRKKRAEELITTNKELAFQNLEKGRLTTELVIANKELAFQNSEKEKRANELEITHKRSEKLNSSVNHLQKVESIGRLTAGISHDFNNILACILGYNEINTEIISDIKDDVLKAEIENNTKQIASAGQRAVMLIDKMMIYARQGTETDVINVRPTSEIIEEVLEMLRPALTSRLKLEFDNNSNKNNGKPNNFGLPLISVLSEGSNLPTQIEINAIDLHQILTNLAINARDAMKNQIGFIRISLRHVVMSEVHCIACAGIMNGDFIELAVTDNGTGIDPKLIRRIFDPFFTTKQVGEGTGLGLSTTMGLVHSANGHIMIDSALTGINKGTSFKLLFPVPVIN